MSKATDPSAYESNYEYAENSRYFTQGWLTNILLRHLDLSSLSKPIWEPAAGRGDMVLALQDQGCSVIASDIDMHEFDAGECPAVESDFLKDPVPALVKQHGFGAIVTNPPYKDNMHELFVRQALAHSDAEVVAMLMRSDFNQADNGRSDSRVHLFKDPKHCFAFEIVVTTRPRWDWWFREKQVASPRFGYSWFVWDRGQFEYHPTTYWESKRGEAKPDDPVEDEK